MAEVRGQWPTPGFTWYHGWRPHGCINSVCILVYFTAVLWWGRVCEGAVICRPCSSHDTDVRDIVPQMHRWGHLYEVKGWAVELTFRSLGALPSIYVTRSDRPIVVLPLTAFCVVVVRQQFHSVTFSCLWEKNMVGEWINERLRFMESLVCQLIESYTIRFFFF